MAKQKKAVPVYQPPYPFVEVIWDDATVATDPWTHRENLPKLEQVCTRGFLVNDTKKLLTVVASVTNTGGDEKEDHYAGVISIPRGMIVEMHELSVSRVAPKPRDPARRRHLLKDALARQQGKNLDGTERRETHLIEEDLGRSIVNATAAKQED